MQICQMINKINEIKDCLLLILEKENFASFEYLEKSLILLSVATGSISIESFATAIGAPVGIINSSCSLAFSITTGFAKKFLKTIRNKKKNTIKLLY